MNPIRFSLPVVFSIAFFLAPSLSFGEPPAFGTRLNPQVRQNHKTIPYVDQIMIGVIPENEPAFGKPLRPELIQRISELADVGITYVRNDDGSHLFQLPKKGYEAETEALCDKIKQDKRIKWCHPEYMFFLDSTTAPNDPIYSNGQQWNLRNESPAGIDAVTAWKMTAGSTSTVIAILDSGIVPHSDISASRLLPGYDFVSDATSAADGGGRDSNPADPGDWSAATGCNASSSWHGTAVTGIIGASTDNGLGVAGINQSAKLLPVRIAGKCKAGTRLDLIDAMQWAAGLTISGVPANANPAKVINLSLAIPLPCSQVTNLQSTIDTIRKKGVVIVVRTAHDLEQA